MWREEPLAKGIKDSSKNVMNRATDLEAASQTWMNLDLLAFIFKPRWFGDHPGQYHRYSRVS